MNPMRTQKVAQQPQHFNIALNNLCAEWGSVQYCELSVILVLLRRLSLTHQTHHWIAKGDPFYGDHLMFQRLYEATSAELDLVAEKAVGLGSTANVDLTLQVNQLYKTLNGQSTMSTIPSMNELAKKSLQLEVEFLFCMKELMMAMTEKGTITPGVENMLGGIYDLHEGHVYLLKQKCNSR